MLDFALGVLPKFEVFTRWFFDGEFVVEIVVTLLVVRDGDFRRLENFPFFGSISVDFLV